jgi:hypothetical protein
MLRLPRDHRPGRDDETDAARVDRPLPDAAQRLLALQQAAGNRAVGAMLQRSPEGTTGRELAIPGSPGPVPRGWDEFWGGVDRDAGPSPAAAIDILDAVLHGETPRVEETGQPVGNAMTMTLILQHDKRVTYWRHAGCIEIDGDEVFLHRPAPAEAVAGWLGLTPVLPQYVPVVPPDIAQGDGKLLVSPPAEVDRALKTQRALEVAIYILENKSQHQPYIARGLAEREDQELAVKILALLCGRMTELTYALNYGVAVKRSDGTDSWVRPGPADVIASRLGIGPDAEPGPLIGRD